MKLEPGAVLGPYEISGSIGAGGMGEVYRARDTRLGREVAVKVLPREVTADPERLARFEREARASSALNHPNIITVHDFAADGEERYLVMELVRGESLRDLVGRGPLPQKRLLAIGAGLAHGLAAAHAAGIVHRDLKPENVMITAEGVPKILDFGLVKSPAAPDAADDATQVKVTSTGMIVGTAAYMSPEQARGETVSFQSDQFTLGMILHEMAAGRHPFRRATAYETVGAILNEEPEPLDESLPEHFRWIVERCLAKDPGERYASTTDLARDLALLRDRGSSPAGRRIAPLPARTSRSPLTLLAATAAIAALLILAAIALRPRGEQPAPGVTAPLHLSVATPQIEVRMEEVVLPVVIAPDARRLIASGVGANGTNDLWLYDLVTGSSRLLVENALAPAWSPDGTEIVFFAGTSLKRMPIDGGPARTLCEALPEGTPTWRGNTILFTQYSGGPAHRGIYRIDAGGGKPERVVVGEQTFPWMPHLLPDGKHFLYLALRATERGLQRDLMLGQVDGGPTLELAGIDSRAEYSNGHILFVREGTVFAQPFNLEKRELQGEPRTVVEGVHFFRNTGLAAFNTSSNGVLAWRSVKGPVRLAWLDRTGVELATIATAPFDIDGRLSSDGSRYAVGVIEPATGTGDLWIYDLTRGSGERLTFAPLDEKAPVWAHDGSRMFYRSDGGGGPPDIFEFAGERRAPFYRGPAVEKPEDVSPDGKWLLFTTFSSQLTADIHALPLDPVGEPQAIATTPFNEFSPRFSPDGRWVAYASNISGRSEIYIRPFPGDGQPTRVSRDGGMRPRWSPRGNELFFLGPAGRFMTVPVGSAFGQPQMLFQIANAVTFEPAPDGKRFLVHLDEERAVPPVNVLVNWEGRLQR